MTAVMRPASSLAPVTLSISAKPQLHRSQTFAADDRLITRQPCNSGLLTADGISSTANPNLSVIEVESKLRDRLRSKYQDVLQAFQAYDVDRNMTISKGQFRRVLEVHCLPMTASQFDTIMNKVGFDANGAVRYCDFLDKFCGDTQRAASADRWRCATSRCGSALSNSSQPEANLDIIEKMLQEKIQKQLPEVTDALRFYDYNRDGTVQRHDLHRILDRLCFVTSDKQFDRIYKKYDFRCNGTINYGDFLSRLGVRLERPQSRQSTAGPKGVVGSRPSTADVAAAAKSKSTAITDAELYELEVDFRKKMRDNHANLKRMFLVFDRNLDGFVSIADLRSILNNFIVPLNDHVFAELMARFGIKATGKLSWEFFLNKFQEPLAGRNGQTIPIKPSHKFFPTRGSDEKLSFEQVVELLLQHVKNGYSSMKSAFLELDKNHDGKITRGEFRELMEKTFPFRLSVEHFQKLLQLIDPNHTNRISYHQFLDLFEERESLAGHKWLKSCHRYNTPKAAIMAWSTLEDNIRDKLELNRSDIVAFFERRDAARSGRTTLKVLRRVIEKFALAVTDEHFNNMINRFVSSTDDAAGQVDYNDFFQKLGFCLRPTDSCGVSAQIIDGSKQTAAQHATDQLNRLEEIEQRAMERSDQMETDEIIVRLRDKMAQKSGDLQRAFQYYASKHRDRITRKDFRVILENFGFLLSDSQFNQICAELSFTNGYMRFRDFVESFEHRRPLTPATTNRPPNYHCNEIRGDELGLPAEEVEEKLRNKLRDNYGDLREAFNNFDDDHNGILTKRNFRQMLAAFTLVITNEEFEKFCTKLGISSRSRITYEDFLNVFQLRETKDGHAWLTSTHRFNTTKPTPKMTAEEGEQVVIMKAHENWHDLAKAFQAMKTPGRTVIRKSELRQTLNKFMMPMDNEQFNNLWTRLDADGKGFINYNDFTHRLMADEFAPTDCCGVSRTIIEENRLDLKRRHDDQLRRLGENQLIEAHHVAGMSTDDVMLQLREYFQDQFSDLSAAFKGSDTAKKGFLTSKDFVKLLGRINILLDDDQLYDLLDRLDLSARKARMTFDNFVRTFEEGRTETFKIPEVEDVEYPQVQFAGLPAAEMEARFRQKVAEQCDNLYMACKSFDQQNSGLIRTADLRRILDNFCFKATDAHFKHLMQSYGKTSTVCDVPYVDYRRFLETFKDQDINKDPQKMLEQLQQLMAANSCQSTEALRAMVQEKVADNALVIGRAFTDVDFAGLGVVSRRDFRDVINTHAVALSDEQFDKLWPTLPVNEFVNVDYAAFLKQCVTESAANQPERPRTSSISRPMTSPMFSGGEQRRLGTATSRCGSAMSARSLERPFTPLVNAEDTETKVRDAVRRHWKQLQRDCRSLDTDNSGQITQPEFISLAERYNFALTNDELFKLLMKYDLHNNDQFSYPDFLRQFVLNSGRQSAGTSRSVHTARSLLRRSSSGPNILSFRSNQEDKEAVQSALDQIREFIVSGWKEIRRELRNVDPSGLATPLQFRQALRNANANLTEDEFSRIVQRFRNSGSDGRVRYDDFFRYYLQNV